MGLVREEQTQLKSMLVTLIVKYTVAKFRSTTLFIA